MNFKAFFLIIILFSLQNFYPQNTPSRIEFFFEDLIADPADLSHYILSSELEKSSRLQIQYDGIINKSLIAYDIDPTVKEAIRAEKYSYNLSTEDLGGGYLRVTFSVSELNYNIQFYFYDGQFISPVSFYTKDWQNFTSKYFNFFVSNPEQFNSFSVHTLDNYVDAILSLLRVSNNDKQLLQEEKIIYVLCSDPDEIKEVTGFNTRGMYILAFDEVVTTFNCHFHELSHLLINFKLKNLPLYTLAFFQEGFAVATGGRGGVARNILLDAGYFLHKSGFIPFNSIIEQKDFFSEDASSSYPVAGIYSRYLLFTYGIESYLNFYTSYSGDSLFVNSLKANMINLPASGEFEKFIEEYTPQSGVQVNQSDNSFLLIHKDDEKTISASYNYYKFSIGSGLTLKTKDAPEDYKSKKFTELFPGREYNGEKYAVAVNKHEISIYNLYTNNLIASYYAGLTEDNLPVPVKNGLFEFYVDKDVFEDDLRNMILNTE
jgi:hypothetical protein